MEKKIKIKISRRHCKIIRKHIDLRHTLYNVGNTRGKNYSSLVIRL